MLQHERYDHTFGSVNIVLVGKYVSLKDSYMSVIKSLEHASLRVGKKLNLQVSLWTLCMTLSWPGDLRVWLDAGMICYSGWTRNI
jgi:hypothetical protein